MRNTPLYWRTTYLQGVRLMPTDMGDRQWPPLPSTGDGPNTAESPISRRMINCLSNMVTPARRYSSRFGRGGARVHTPEA